MTTSVRFNKCLGIAVLAGSLMASSVHADDGISGFRQFEFGSSVSDIEKLIAITLKETESGSNVIYRSQEPTIIGDKAYMTSFEFEDDSLKQVNLTQNEAEVLRMHCDLIYQTTADQVTSTYGPWNTTEKDISLLGVQIKAQRKNFTDTSSLVVNQVHTLQPNEYAGACSVSVMYNAPSNGGTF